MSEQAWPERKIEVEEIRCPAHGSPEWFPSLNHDGIECDQCESQLVTYIPAESVQAVAERLREEADTASRSGQYESLNALADQLTSLCNRGSDDAT